MRITTLDNFTHAELRNTCHSCEMEEPAHTAGCPYREHLNQRTMVSTNEPVRLLYTACASDLELERWPAMPEDLYQLSSPTRKGPVRGVAVVGARHEVNFVVVGFFTSGEGEDRELAGWYLEPTEECVREVPGCRGIQLEIYND